MNTKILSHAIVLITHSGCYLILSSNFIHFNKFCGTIIVWKCSEMKLKWMWEYVCYHEWKRFFSWTAELITRVHIKYKIMHLNCWYNTNLYIYACSSNGKMLSRFCECKRQKLKFSLKSSANHQKFVKCWSLLTARKVFEKLYHP